MKSKDLIIINYFILFVAIMYALTEALSAFLFVIKYGYPKTSDFTWLMIARIAKFIGYVLSSVLFYLVSKNVKLKIVFDKVNEKLLTLFGLGIVICGIVTQFIMLAIRDEASIQPNLLSLISFCLISFAIVLKIGIKMKNKN